jgi:hypothetical protein
MTAQNQIAAKDSCDCDGNTRLARRDPWLV